MKIKKPKKQSISALKKKAWRVFSLWIRNRGAVNGTNVCVTCGVTKPIGELDAGHFISRRYQGTLFDERNTWPQCQKCNRFLNGNWSEYYLFMKKKFGQSVIDELISKSKELTKLGPEELEGIHQIYKEKLASL